MVDLMRRISRAHDSSPPVGVGPRPRVYKDWKHSTAMKLACEAVSSRTLSLRRAEEHFGVPKSTIHDRINKKVATSTPGPEKYLSTIEGNFSLGSESSDPIGLQLEIRGF